MDELLDKLLTLVSIGEPLTFEELLVDEDMCWGEVVEECKTPQQRRKLGKVRERVHLNNLKYVSLAPPKDPMLPVIMKRLGAEFGYVDRKDVTSKGEKVELNVVIPPLLANC